MSDVAQCPDYMHFEGPDPNARGMFRYRCDQCGTYTAVTEFETPSYCLYPSCPSNLHLDTTAGMHALTEPSPQARQLVRLTALEQPEALMAMVLQSLGIDWSNDPQFQETPRRFIRYLRDHFAAIDDPEMSIFPSTYKGMVTEKDIIVDGMCPHHLLPVDYQISIAYMPEENVFGLSKLVRLARHIAERPLLQEDITEAIPDRIEQLLEGVRGVAVVVKGQHACMSRRGVKSAPLVVTSAVRGLFRDDLSVKEEFLAMVR